MDKNRENTRSQSYLNHKNHQKKIKAITKKIARKKMKPMQTNNGRPFFKQIISRLKKQTTAHGQVQT